MKTYDVAVFMSRDQYSDREWWSAYVRDYNPAWSSYRGNFMVQAKTLREAKRDAIRMAKQEGADRD